MRKVVAIGGLPATGKSTLVRRFMADSQYQQVQLTKLLTAHYSPKHNLYILGDYSEDTTFSGTDRLSMSVQPEAVEWLKNAQGNVLFEGDRLFNQSFLESALDLVNRGQLDLKILILNTPKQLLIERHATRLDTQSEQFLLSRETKIDNIRSNLLLMYWVVEANHNTAEDTRALVNWLQLELWEENEEGVVELLG